MALTGIGTVDVVLPGWVTGETCVFKGGDVPLLRLVIGGVVALFFGGVCPDVVSVVIVALTCVDRGAVVIVDIIGKSVALPVVLKGDGVTLPPGVGDGIVMLPDVVKEVVEALLNVVTRGSVVG